MKLEDRRRDDIDGIRGIAILGVFLFHLFPKEVPGGFLGVDVFFVLSGYLITRHIKGREMNSLRDILLFYRRRLTRIWPSLLAMLLSFSPLLIFYGEDRRQAILRSMFYSLLAVSNVFFGLHSSYFDQEARLKPFLHTWSLSVEIQFYLLLPIIMIAFKHTRNEKLLCILLIIASFLACYLKLTEFPAYYNTFLRLSEFFCGSLVHFISLRPQSGLKRSVPSTLSFFGLLWFFLFFSHNSTWHVPGLGCAFPCIFTCVIIKSPDSFVNNYVLSSTFLQRVGRISYSLYLYHWPIIVYYQHILDKSKTMLFDAFVIVVLAYSLSYLSYTHIENKERRAIQGLSKLCRNYIYVLIFIAPSFIFMYFIFLRPTSLPPASTSVLEKELMIYNKQNIVRQSFESVPAWKTKCGAVQSNRTALIVGDSFAGSLVSFADYIGRKFDIVFHIWTISACSPLLNKDRVWLHAETPHWIDVVTSCGSIMQSWFHRVNESKYDIVFITGKWKLYTFREPSESPKIKMIRLFKDSKEGNVTKRALLTFGTSKPNIEAERQFFERSLKNALMHVSGITNRVVLVSDIPALGPSVLSCEKYLSFKKRLQSLKYSLGTLVEQKIKKTCTEQMSSKLSENLKYTNNITKNISSQIGIINIQPTEFLCKKSSRRERFLCNLRVGTRIIYKDSYHLNDAGGILLAMRWIKHGKSTLL